MDRIKTGEDARHWANWRRRFETRQSRSLPDPFVKDPCLVTVPASVARSLAIFQLGESGGGTIVAQARRSRLPGLDDDYAGALALFVAEERHHAELLACCVRMLGGTLIRRHWTARLFVFARRLIGLRVKVAVLLAAEIVGLCYYRLIASRLPASRLRDALHAIVRDERVHLDFHCEFLRGQVRNGWQRTLVRGAWRALSVASACAVLVDHRGALRDLGVPPATAWRKWMALSRQAERVVTGERRTPSEVCRCESAAG